MRPSTVLLLASALPLICGTAAGHENSTDERASRSLIMVEGAQAADSDDLDPDDVRRRRCSNEHRVQTLPTPVPASTLCVRLSRWPLWSRQFLWETLPGRCCFYGGPDPLDPR